MIDIKHIRLFRKKPKPSEYPIEVCKFFRLNGECTELTECLCPFKRMNYSGVIFGDDKRIALCDKYKVEGGD